MPKKASRRYTLKDVIENVDDKRLERMEGQPCFYAQTKNTCLDNAQEERNRAFYVGTYDTSFFGPFRVRTLLGETDAYCIIFEE